MKLDQYSIDDLLLKRKGLRRRFLSESEGLQPLRIAVLGGSTSNEVVDLLELFLLEAGFQPTFHQSEYGRYYEDSVLDPSALIEFAPDLVYIHTSCLNIQIGPSAEFSKTDFQQAVTSEVERYKRIWTALSDRTSAQIIQNNFELPQVALLGNMDSVSYGGATRFFLEMNVQFAEALAGNTRVLVQDVHSLSARLGLTRWFDPDRYFSYKILTTIEGSMALAHSLMSIVKAIYGKSRKLLVLDLDNTLWGGVIGDDGVDKIQIGRETPVAEAYTAFQEYCVKLHRRGVLLAVCSKNDEEVAKQGFSHPDSVLKLEHFSSFKANWEPKHENILAIANELNLGVDSFVFVDDNPAERAIVAGQISGIAVPNVGNDVSRYAAIIQEGRYFESVSISQEDLSRAALYQENSARTSAQAEFADYGEYLDSLEMVAEIMPFNSLYLERIAQLTNKTNQFNLTTKRYTLAEMQAVLQSDQYIGLYGRLADKFGDNGLISIILGRKEEQTLHLELWLMSCRVLKRDMEVAMLDVLVESAKAANLKSIRGYYVPTKKNGMVANHYEKLGFEPVSVDPETEASVWHLELGTYIPHNRHIKLSENSNG